MYKFRDSPDIADNYTSLDDDGTYYHIQAKQAWGSIPFRMKTPRGMLIGEHSVEHTKIVKSDSDEIKVMSAILSNKRNRMTITIYFEDKFISLFHENGRLSLVFNPETGFYEGTTDNGMDVGEEILNIDMNPEMLPGDV